MRVLLITQLLWLMGRLGFRKPVYYKLSILQTFHSWVATSHLRQPLAFLSHNSSDRSWLTPLMNVLFWGRCDFPISFMGRDISNCVRFPWNICNGCSRPTEDTYSSGHLVLSHFGTCMCSNVETNPSWTCLVSGLLSFEHPSVLLFCLITAVWWLSLLQLAVLSRFTIVVLSEFLVAFLCCLFSFLFLVFCG